jgi:hypothetical protein
MVRDTDSSHSRQIKIRMSHFSQSNWVDFIRNVLTPAEHARMQRHLDEDCNECRRVFEIWHRVARCFLKNKAYSPPENAVSLVKASFVPPESWTNFSKLARLARLVFDSNRGPAVACIRGIKSTSRQLLHEAEPFVIDIRLESEPGRRTGLLIGQVLDRRFPNKTVGNIDVVLLSGEDFVSKTSANASGEFEFGFGLKNDLKLFIDIRGERAIGIVLPDFIIDDSDENGIPNEVSGRTWS